MLIFSSEKGHLKACIIYTAAILTGLALPLLFLGRGALAACLGLAFLLVIGFIDYKALWTKVNPYLKHPIALCIVVIALGLMPNIFVSARLETSFETWLRTFALLSAVFVLLMGLRERFDTILNWMVIGLVCFLALALVVVSELSLSLNYELIQIKGHYFLKPIMNGLLLMLPLVLLWGWQANQTKFFISVFICGAFLIVALFATTKITVVGFVAMSGFASFLWAYVNLSRKSFIILFTIFSSVVLVALSIWLGTEMNGSSRENAHLAFVPVWLVDLHRQLIWVFSYELFVQSPWVGFGLNASNYQPGTELTIAEYFGPSYEGLHRLSNASIFPGHAHNFFLELLLDSGLIGALPMFVLVGMIFTYGIKCYLRTKNIIVLALLTVNVGYWGTGLINFSFWSVWWQSIYLVCTFFCLILYLFPNNEKSHE